MKNTYFWNVKEFKKMVNPNKNDNVTKYVMYVNLKSFTDDLFNNWMDTNPRYQNTKSKQYKKISESLNDAPSDFYKKNRGLLFSAKNVSFDNTKEIATITFDDNQLHGNIDGGHTLRAIINEVDETWNNYFVFVEILTNTVEREEVVSIAEARNTSSQVDEKAIAEMLEQFEPLKAFIEKSNSVIKNKVYYSMNENKEDLDKTIDVRTIIAILNMFNTDLYPNGIDSQSPILSYSSKASSLEKYLNLVRRDAKSIFKLKNVYLDILELYDSIETTFFNEPILSKMKSSFPGIDWYLLKNKKTFSLIKNTELSYKVPTAIIYPILGGFRALIETDKKTGFLKWKKDINPLNVWKEKQKYIINNFIFESELLINPNGLGKNKLVWNSIFSYLLAAIDNKQ